jgi:hypothetical protein
MRPKHSLNHNIKSVPLVLTGNIAEVLAHPPFTRKMVRPFFIASRGENDAARTNQQIPHDEYRLALGSFRDAGLLEHRTSITLLASDLIAAQYATIGSGWLG